MLIRKAVKEDIGSIKKILKVVNLPFEDLDEQIYNFLILELGDKILGTVGLEGYENYGLFRSFAILPEYQGKGLGQKLFDAAISSAKQGGLSEIYLLTETAEHYFSKRGFKYFPRENVPPPIRKTQEFNLTTCFSAVCMKLLI